MTAPLRVLIVDDEPPARRRLARLLAAEAPDAVLAEAADADAALAAIAADDPDLLLLDIRLPDLDGVELARRLGPRPVVIFTTAHAEFAVDAFDAAALDYLLKPVTAERLGRALARARARLAAAPATPPRILARTGDRVTAVTASAIARFWSTDKYTAFVVDGEEHLIDEPLVALATRLAPWGFLRVHRAELVQVARVRVLHELPGGVEVELDDGQRARVSRRALPALRRRLASP